MENLDLREILKDVPRGTKLYSPLFGECSLFAVNNRIELLDSNNKKVWLYYNGKYQQTYNGECMLFPSKEQRDWSQFKVPCQFKIGDIIYHKHNDFISIYKGDGYRFNVGYYTKEKLSYTNLNTFVKIDNSNYRLATNAEKELFYNELQNEGYFWNDKTNSLEKYKFKIRDKIQNINTKNRYKVININQDYYILENNCILECSDQNKFENVKFDITTLKPYDEVLVRDIYEDYWRFATFGFYKEFGTHPFHTIGGIGFDCCIPYKGNEHLIGTKNECDEYYKTW
jgi:hypothetical protein